MNHGGVTAQQFGLLVAFEMVTAMVCYIPSRIWPTNTAAARSCWSTFVFFTLFPVTLLWAHNFAWLALAFVVRGLEGIRRAGAQGAHHRRGGAGTARADLRRVLSDPRLRGDHRFVSRRVAVEHQSRRRISSARPFAARWARSGSGGLSTARIIETRISRILTA